MVVRTIAAADRARSGVGAVADHRARLQTEALAELDRVPAVVENTVEALVQVRHVVSAVQIVVDEDLPVAVERVVPPLEPDESVEIEVFDAARQVGRRESSSSDGPPRVDPDEHPFFPHADLDRDETIRRRVEVGTRRQSRACP